MKHAALAVCIRAKSAWGMTLVEVMVATAIASLALAAAAALWLFGIRSFVAMGNYRDLDAKNRNAMDWITCDMRQASRVIDFKNTGSSRWLTLTNRDLGTTVKYAWDADDRTLVCEKTGWAAEVLLSECDRWDFALYQRTPMKGLTNAFYPATNLAGTYDLGECKLIDMTWKCSRTILGKEANTETVQTTQVVLRNKTAE